METITELLQWLYENRASIGIIAGFLIRAVEKWFLKKKQKKELHDAYGRALQAAILQLKNDRNGKEKHG